ncbi:hypothetical protein QFZ49_002619 [Streptomyces turgidiscabies]|uniref:Uncharacterized protein n=1 Tax=Streptomyces turgidiscabies TaxID=85558 RepID=A0ABU0RL12_9ACTN|nr:hypothetical protein [Streptomyces turgidiscabies]
MNERSFSRSSRNRSQSASSLSMYDCSTRNGGNSGFSATGVARSAPTSNRSFCTRVSTLTTATSSPPSATAVPITAFASLASAYAEIRRSVLATLLMSPRAVVPWSPVLV